MIHSYSTHKQVYAHARLGLHKGKHNRDIHIALYISLHNTRQGQVKRTHRGQDFQKLKKGLLYTVLSLTV